MRQLEVRNKARRLDVIRMGQHKLFVLCRAGNLFAVVRGLQGAVNASAIAMALRSLMPKTSRAGKVWGVVVRCDKTIDHFTLGH